VDAKQSEIDAKVSDGQKSRPHRRRRLRPAEELDVLIRARYPIIYVVTWEEERVERCIAEIAQHRNKRVQVWSCTQGLVRHGIASQPSKGSGQGTADPIAAMDTVLQEVEPTIYIFKDLHPFMTMPPDG
jgi:hypothetical protein